MHRVSAILSSALLAVAQPALAANEQSGRPAQVVPNSYIVTFKASGHGHASPIRPAISAEEARRRAPPPFGEHSNGQDRDELARSLNINGKVARIFDAINAAHLRIDAAEAERLKSDPRVLRVEPDSVWRVQATTQGNPGWGLDRIDQAGPPLNGAYTYGANGAGQTIYILDSGLNLNNPYVAAEFGGRATVYWDINYERQNKPRDVWYGQDCSDHGTAVASVAAGSTHGVAKGATVIAAKITNDCSRDADQSTVIAAFNWLANNAPRGTIVNKSLAPPATPSGEPFICGFGIIETATEDAMRAAFDKGIIIVNAAANDGCDADRFTPTRMPEVFVVGASDASRFSHGQDTRAYYPGEWASRYGSNIAAFAPGTNVKVLDYAGYSVTKSGTSLAAPHIAGLFAVACEAYKPFCSTNGTAQAYDALKAFGTMGKVVDPGGVAMPASTVNSKPTPSRFISRQVW